MNLRNIIQLYKRLLSYVWYDRGATYALLFTLGLIVIDGVFVTYFPYIWQGLIRAENLGQPLSWFIKQAALLFVVWFFIKNGSYLREIVFFPLTNQVIKQLRLQTILKVHTVSLSNLEQYHLQEIINATNRVSQSIRHFMHLSFIAIFPSLVKIISISIALLSVSSPSWGIIIVTFLSLAVLVYLLPGYVRTKAKAWQVSDQVTAAMGETLRHTSTIRFQPTVANATLEKLFEQEASWWKRYNLYFYRLPLISNAIFFIGTGIVFCSLAWAYKQGHVALDKWILIYGLIGSLYTPLVTITGSLKNFFGCLVDLTKITTILNLPSEHKPLILPPFFPPQAIRVVGVTFSYSLTEPLLQDIHLTIQPGDKIGLLGATGAGKSSLCQIIAGLLQLNQGEIWYGNLPIDKISPASLGTVLCYLPQRDPMQEWIIELVEDKLVVQKKKFSGGEYQCYILRKFLGYKPQIAILDETFNAMDEVTAGQLLDEVIATVPTIILVTHNPLLSKKMQRRVVLSQGRLHAAMD